MPTPAEKRVSVVVAAYNMAEYLPVAVRSALDQTVQAAEIHVVDDGSTDRTREAMRAFEGEPRIVYHWQPNGGQAKAKNRGIRAATGDYIAFLDADDLWVPRKLELQLPVFDRCPSAGVVYTDYRRIDADGKALGAEPRRYFSGRITGPLLVDNFVTGMAAIVRRECFDRVGLFDESLPMGIDYDLWLRISAYYEFEYLDEVTYLYRQWAGQMSRNQRERMDCAMSIMRRFLANHGDLVDAATVRRAWAHTFTSRGLVTIASGGPRRAGFADFARALAHRPHDLRTWRAMAKVLVRVGR